MTFAIESNRVRRLDNDTAAATTIATGPGGWLDGEVLPDPCPTDAIASPALFTTTGGSGAFTITAAPSCTWSIDASAVPGLTVTTSSGTGSASVPFSWDRPRRLAAAGPYRRPLHRDRTGPAAPQHRRAWTDRAAALHRPRLGDRGERDAEHGLAAAGDRRLRHAWAWPTSGAAPIFIGATNASRPRPDIAAVYGSADGAAEFLLPVTGLPVGTYPFGVYAFSARRAPSAQEKGVLVTVLPGTRGAIDPLGPSVPRNFVVSGWAADVSATIGPGVDSVHAWAYPASGAPPVWVGAATYCPERADVAALYGEPSGRPDIGCSRRWPGQHTRSVVFAHSTVTGAFTPTTAPLTVLTDSVPDMNVDEPGPSSPIAGPFQVRGWAIDRGAETDLASTPSISGRSRSPGCPALRRRRRAGRAPRRRRHRRAAVRQCRLPAHRCHVTGGHLLIAVYARSSVTQSFNNARLVRITVQ